jgi:glycosyltransferase 2 family protein
MLKRDRLAAIAFALKLAITAGLFAYLLRKVDIAPVVRQLGAMSPAAAVGAEALLLLQLGLLALRWQIVGRLVDAPMRAGQLLRLSAIGHFFNQVLPSGFAGDAARAWLAAREGVRVGPAVRAILCDRVIGLLVLVGMVTVTLFALPDLTADKVPGRSSFVLVALLGVAGLATLFLIGTPVARLLARHRLTRALGTLTDDLHRALFRSRGRSAAILALAVAVQLLNVAAMHWCARGMRIDLDFGAAWVIVPAVMLVSMAPISFAGWGVREGAMIVGLGLAGIAAADALAVSVAFGLLQLVLGVPGGLLWLARRAAPTGTAGRREPG